jgi:anionic cell wall polymer biosynthesis LytR-Cps2A-Psr (LCP) family protein
VDVYSENEFTPSYNAYPDDREAPPEVEGWTVHEGMNHMTGAQALVFARERKSFDDGDRTRIKNQQAVFEAMIKKATSSKTMLMSYNKILSSLKRYFEMSFSSKELRALVKYQLRKNPSWLIYRNQITGGDGSMTTYTTGDEYCYVMTQDAESIGNAKSLIQAVVNGQQLEKDDEGNVYIVQTEEGEGTEETTEE